MSGFIISNQNRNGVMKNAINLIAFSEKEKSRSISINSFSFAASSHGSISLWRSNTSMLYINGYPFFLDDVNDNYLHKVEERINKGSDLREAVNIKDACSIVYIKNNTISIVTDKLGVYPVYYWLNSTGYFAIGSSLDAIKEASREEEFQLDLASVWEKLICWKIKIPNTIYKEIKEFPPYSNISYHDNEGFTINTKSLTPTYNGESFKELQEELSSVVNNLIREKTSKLKNTTLFLSGGFDSRAVLSNICSSTINTVTVIDDEHNYECNIAKKLAAIKKCNSTVIERDHDFYFGHIKSSSKITEGMSSPIDCHFTPIINNTELRDAELVLSGCYVDYLFKGLQSDSIAKYKIKRLNWGTKLRTKDEYVNDPFFKHRLYLLDLLKDSETLKEEVLERLKRYKPTGGICTLKNEDDYWFSEYHRLLPFSREETAGTRCLMSRTMRWSPIFANSDIVDMYCKIPVKFKLDGHLWRGVVATCAPEFANLRNANSWSKPSAGNNTHYFQKNLAELSSMIRRKFNPHTSIGSTQNFVRAKKYSEKYGSVKKELEDVFDLGVSKINRHKLQSYCDKDINLMFLLYSIYYAHQD